MKNSIPLSDSPYKEIDNEKWTACWQNSGASDSVSVIVSPIDNTKDEY
jgi:hypothetical protein